MMLMLALEKPSSRWTTVEMRKATDIPDKTAENTHRDTHPAMITSYLFSE